MFDTRLALPALPLMWTFAALFAVGCAHNHITQSSSTAASSSSTDAPTVSAPRATVTSTVDRDEFAYTVADGTVWLADAKSGARRQLISAPIATCDLGDCLGHDAQWSPDGRYLSYRSNERRLIALEVDTGRETVIDDTGGADERGFETRWAPDGAQVAYSKATSSPENRGLWVADLAGHTRNLAIGALLGFEWSPDSTRIAYATSVTSRASGGRGEALYVVNTDGTGGRQVADGVVPLIGGMWSPNGRMISYFRNEHGGSATIGDMTLLGVDSGAEISLGQFSSDEFPQWSPDRSRAVFQNQLVDPSGQPQQLFDRPDAMLGWSPDLSKVAYVVGPGFGASQHALVVLDVQTGVRTTIDSRQPPQSHALNPGYQSDWSRDSSRLAFAAFHEPPGSSMFVADVATGTVQPVGAGSISIAGDVSYAPDDSLLLMAGYAVVDNRETNRAEIWIANADGSGERMVSDGQLLPPGWRPLRH